MEKLRIGLIGLAAAVMGFMVPGCNMAQPLPECTVVGSQGAFGVTPYWGQVKETAAPAGADCSQFPALDALAVGMQRWFQADGGSKPYRVAIRPSRLTDMWNGAVFPPLNQDPSNDCTNETDCDVCVVTLADGGLALGADNSIPVVGGDAQFPDGGTLAVDDTNECGPVAEDYYPEDPNDPTGRKLVGEAAFSTQFPNGDGVCSLETFVSAKQEFAAVDIINPDGSPGTFPAMTVEYEWSDFNIISTAKVPGTAFTAKLKLTEGQCAASYDITAFWPIVGCEEDADCNPVADADAGQIFGSGINPEFKPKCDTNLGPDGLALIDHFWGTTGVCVPGVDLTTLE